MKNIMMEWFKTQQRTALASAITETKQPKPALMMQLEPRIMFDGAAVATAVDIAHNDVAVTKDAAIAEKAPVDAPALAPSPQVAEAPPVDMSIGIASTRHEIIFVDTSVENYQSLLADINPNAEVVLINAGQDGLKVIADTLEGRSVIDAIHILSHGDVGKIQLGGEWIDSQALATQTELLNAIGSSLSAQGDILLYGCRVTADGTGVDFINSLASATHADVAASTNYTGAAVLGGDWILESHNGLIETQSLSALSYTGILAQPADENYDTNSGASYTADTFTLDGIKYTIVGSNPGNYTNIVSNNSAMSLLGNNAGDYFMFFDLAGAYGISSIKVEAADGSNFKLDGFSFDGAADVNITVTPYSGATAGTALSYSSNGALILQENINTSANSNFQDITSVVFAGGNISLALDNLNFEAAVVANNAPAIANLNGDSVAWAGVGSTVTLDASANASLTDTELGALNSGNGNWSGASLTVQRSTAVAADTFDFNTSGALFTVSGNTLQSGGQTFATFTNTGGVLTVNFTSSATAATTALVNDVTRHINYRSDTPAGDAIIRFTLNDGTTAGTAANVTVTSDTIYVTNTTDTAVINVANGVSFSEAIAIAAADVTGSQTIAFASSLASTALTVNSVSIGESLTFDMDSASGMSLTSGTITLSSGTLTLSNGTSDTATISSVLASSGAITKAGAGTITFSGTNTYTGATTLSAGTLTVSGGNAIANTSSVSVASGATFALSGNETIGNLSGAGSINVNSNTLTTTLTADTTFSGDISGAGGFNINQTGAATFALTLSGTNTYTGGTTLQNYGWLKLNGDAAFSDSNALRVNGNSKLTLLSNQTVGSIASNASTASLALGTFTLTAGGDDTDTSVAGVISGTGALVKQGNGTMTLSGTNTYTGTTTVSAGTLAVASDSNLGSGNLTLDNGTLQITGATTIDNALAIASDGTVQVDAAATLSGQITGSSRLSKTGTADLTLANSGNINMGGEIAVFQGTLLAADGNYLTPTVVLLGGNLTFTGATTYTGVVAVQTDATITTNANVTFSNFMEINNGSDTLTKAGAGTLTLSSTGNSQFMVGKLAINAGTVSVSDDRNLSDGSVTINGGTLAITGTNTFDNSFIVGASGGTIDVASSQTATLSGGVSGSGALTKAGAGTLTLSSTSNSSATNVALNVTGGLVGIDNASKLVGGSITLGGGGLLLGNSVTINRDITLTSAASINVTDSSSISLGGIISGSGPLTLATNGGITLSGTNTFTGNTAISSGQVYITNNAALGTAAGSTTVSSGASLRLSTGVTNTAIAENFTLSGVGASGVLGALSSSVDATFSGTITLAASTAFNVSSTRTLTLSGAIGETGGARNLSKSVNGGTLALTGSNTYTGTTTISGGILSIAADSGLGAGALTLANNTTFKVTGATTIDNAITLSGTATIQTDAAATVSGSVTGSGNLTKTGSGTLTLSNTGNESTLTGGMTISAGTVSISDDDHMAAGTLTLNGGTLSIDGPIVFDNDINLAASSTINAGGNSIASGVISGAGDLTKTGSLSLQLTNANTYSGATFVNAGYLLANNANSLGTTAGATTVASGATLYLSGSFTLAEALNLTGTGMSGNGAIYTPAGNSTVSGPVTLTGNTSIVHDGDLTFSGGITDGAGSYSLTKQGTGALTLSGTASYDGSTTISSGSLSIGSDSHIGSGALTLAASTTLAVTGATTIDNAIALSGGTVTVNTSANTSFSGNITGAGGLTKAGTSTLTLSGTDSYIGATNISAGTLLVNGALNATSNTTVASGATLGGSGSIGSNVTVNSGGTLSPGNSAGTLTINGDLAMASGSTLAIEIDGATAGTGYDQVIVNGNVDVSGATLSVTHGYVAGSGDIYNIVVNDAADAVTGSFSGVSEGATVTAGGNSTVLTTSYIGATGNDITLTAPVMPVVTSVSSSTPNGTYKIGDTISVSVTFDMAVFVSGGTPTLLLETGTVDRTLNYVSGSGSTTLVFDYTVQAGDLSADLDYATTGALALNGSTIQDALTQNANLTLASPGAANSLGANKALVVDGVVPTATIVVADTALAVGETSLVTITFSEAVTGLDTSDFTVANGTLGTVTTGDGGVTWTATLTPTASTTDSSNLITLDNSGVLDAAGNAGVSTTDSNNYAIDTVRPTASIVVADTALAVGETSLVTITFSEAVTGLTTVDLTVANGVLSGLSSSDGGITWTATLTPNASVTDTSNLITLDNTGVQDSAGNAGTSTIDSNNYAIDTVRPTATIVVADTALKAGETSLVTITFSEAVSGFTTADLTVANGVVSGLSSSDGGVTWTATLTPTASTTDPTNLITLDKTGVQDSAGNAGTSTTDSNNYAIDTARPTASIVVADTALAVGETSLVTITFNEAVSGLTTADLTVANGVVSGLSSSDGGITWTATLTPTASTSDTSNIITLDNTGVQDAAGNTGTGTTDSNNYAIDTLRPTATIVVADSSLAVGETSLVTITFNEAVTGFTNADLTIANGTLSPVSSSDGGITWTATFTPTTSITDPTNLITLTNSGVQDAAGNAGTGTTDSNNYAIDTVRPSATIVVADTALKAGETSLVTLTFSEAVANFDNNDLTVANGTLSTMTTSDGGITWTGTLTPTADTTDTSNAITFNSTGVIDGAGNIGAGPIDSNNYAIDTLRPTASIVVADSALAIGETSPITITFNEAVTGLTVADLTVANGLLSGLSSSDGGITWTATLTPTASITDTTNVITLDNTGVQDSAGNTGTGATNSNNYAIDTLRPTASIVVADTALAAGETSLVTITFSEAVTGFTTADLTVANGVVSGLSSSDGGITWTATLTPTTNTTDTTNLITLANTGVQDLAGNAGTGTTDSNNYAIDTLRPTASIVVADTALAAGETSLVTITFSEAVSNFNNGDLSVSNGSLSNVSSSDGGVTWTATFTPSANVTDTTNLITLSNTGVTDAAGNTGIGSTDSNNYAIDTLRPTAIIQVADSALAVGETSLVTITFNEAVTGLTNADLTIANGTLSPVSSADGGITWTATFTPTAGITDSTNVITLADNGVIDAAGNTGSGTTDSNNYTVDSVRPTATIVVADTALAAGETSVVTITFSEAVTGFTTVDLTIANGAVSGLSTSDGGTTWTATLTPTTDITDTSNLITLANSGVQDLAGNTGTGTTDSNNYSIDTLVPTVSSVSVPIGVTYNTGDVLTFTVNTSETVLVNTAGGTPRIALDIGGTTAYATYVAGSNTNTLVFQYTVKAGDNDANGISLVGLSANSGTLRDAAGNNLNIALNNVGSTAALNIDTVAPTFTSQVQDSPNAYDQSVNFLVNFSEAVDHVDVTDFSLVTTDTAKATISSFQQIDNHSWLISVTNISGLGTVRIDVNANNDITDNAGNALSGSLTGSGGFAAQPLPAQPIPPTPAPLAPTTSDVPTPTQAVAPLIVLSPDPTSIGGATNITPLTTVEAPALATVVPLNLSVTGASNSPTSLDTSTPGTDPIGIATATNSGTPNPQSGLVHLGSSSNQAPTGPASGPSIDRINTAQDSGLQGLPVVATQNVQTGVPLYIPLPNTQSADVNQQLSVDVRLQNGKPLMSWLRFDPVTGTLNGQAPKGFEGKVHIQINVRDSKGNTSSSIMELNFNGDRGQSGERDNKPAPVKAKPGAQLMGKPGLNEQFALYGKGAHQLEADALLSALNQLSLAPTQVYTLAAVDAQAKTS